MSNCNNCHFQGTDCHIPEEKQTDDMCDRFEHADSHLFEGFAANHARMTKIIELLD